MDKSKEIIWQLLSNQTAIMLNLANLTSSPDRKAELAMKATETMDLIEKLGLLGR